MYLIMCVNQKFDINVAYVSVFGQIPKIARSTKIETLSKLFDFNIIWKLLVKEDFIMG